MIIVSLSLLLPSSDPSVDSAVEPVDVIIYTDIGVSLIMLMSIMAVAKVNM